jgi:predicted RNA-binding Zn-ribbon protein involved in translation (DUF1610 family)
MEPPPTEEKPCPPPAAPEAVALGKAAGSDAEWRSCPTCGHPTRQRLIGTRRDHRTYWCTECAFPYDVEP